MMAMKLAFVYDAVYPYVKGGVEKRIWELSRRLSEAGHEVHIFGMKYWRGEDVVISEGVFLHGVCGARELYAGHRRSITEAIYYACRLLVPLLKNKYDVIDSQAAPYFNCFSAKIAAVLRGSCLVITWHEVWGDYWREYLGWKGAFGKIIERLIARLTPTMVAVSARTARGLKSIAGARSSIRIIPNGVDFDEIARMKKADLESDIIYVGRLNKNKNIDVLIKAMQIVRQEAPDTTCLILGNGPERDNLRKLADELDLCHHVVFRDFCEEYGEVISYMKSSKVFALPSTREGFGIVVIEANACGLPVVAIKHDMNAACDLLDSQNGFVSEFSAEDFARKILLALGDRLRLKDGCIASAKQYDWSRIVTSLESCYASFLEGGDSEQAAS